MKFNYLFTVVYLITLLSCNFNAKNNNVLSELNKQIIPLENNQPFTYNDKTFENLLNWNNFQYIGLGEATHGTKNFFELKHRLFKYLVENHNFKVLAYEFSFRKSLIIDEYICGGENVLENLFKGELWIQDNYEVLALIEWMRSYNANKASEDKIHFIGIDSQLDAYYLEELGSLLKKYSSELAKQLPRLFDQLSSLAYVKYRGISEAEYLKRKRILTELKTVTKDFIQQNKFKNSRSQILLHLIETTIRSHEFLYTYVTTGKNLRDFYLTQNALWIKKYLGNQTKIAVWAHNAHIANNPSYYENGGGSMGKYLRDSLADSYLSIATSFSRGKFRAVMLDSLGNDTKPLICKILKTPPKGSINELFSKAEESNFVLGIRKIEEKSKLYSYFDMLRPMIGVGDLYLGTPEQHFTNDRIINLIEAYDLLFHLTDTDAVNIIER